MKNYYIYFMVSILFSCFISCTPESIEEQEIPIFNKEKQLPSVQENKQEQEKNYYIEGGEGDEIGSPIDMGN